MAGLNVFIDESGDFGPYGCEPYPALYYSVRIFAAPDMRKSAARPVIAVPQQHDGVRRGHDVHAAAQRCDDKSCGNNALRPDAVDEQPADDGEEDRRDHGCREQEEELALSNTERAYELYGVGRCSVLGEVRHEIRNTRDGERAGGAGAAARSPEKTHALI